MIHKETKLDQKTEELVETVIDCGYTVHQTLGPGFLESIYRNAFGLELAARSLPFESEWAVVVSYRETPVGIHKIDLMVAKTVIVELKATKWLEPAHQAQLLSYMKATGLRVGLLMNFGQSTLVGGGLRRFVL